MLYNRKKELLKSGMIIAIILLLAVVSTYYIYYKFNKERTVDYSSKSLDVIYHEKTGPAVTITKVTPVTDAVGLTSMSYNFTVKNNLTEPVKFKIKLVDDLEAIVEGNCQEYLIDKQFIRVAIKKEKEDAKIYNLSDLDSDTLATEKIKALDEKEYSVRVWTNNETTLPNGSNLHYHGLIQVVENDNSLAAK